MYFLGDIHGGFSHLLYTLAKLAKRNINIVQVGDFGIGFTSQENCFKNLDVINEAFKEWDSKLWVIRGNHDDPKYFKGKLRDKINKTYSNIYFIEDYEVIEIEGKHLFCVGGGVSIDRTFRTINQSYWKDEVVVYEPGKIKHTLLTYKKIDIVVTHSAPMWCYPQGVDAPIVREYCSADPSLKEDLIEEREILGTILDEIHDKYKFTHHYYGHFHNNHRWKSNDTSHILIGIGDLLNHDKVVEMELMEELKK